MSGGHFDYAQYRIEDIASSIDELIKTNKSKDIDSFGQEIGRNYPDGIIKKFDEAKKTLSLAAKMAQHIDWLVSGDDGEDSFEKRWIEEVDSVRDFSMEIATMYLEIRDQKHEMFAEGSADKKPTTHMILERIKERGFMASNIDIFYDKLQRFWRFTAKISIVNWR